MAALLLLGALAGCASGSAADFAAPGSSPDDSAESTGSATDDGATPDDETSDDEDGPSDAVDVADVPSGYEVVQADGVGLAFAVPEPWSPIELGADDLAAGVDQLAESNPELAGMASMAGGMFADARGMGSAGNGRGGRKAAAVAYQLDLRLTSIPELMVDQMEQQLDTMGATDIVAERVDVTGLPEGAKALSVSAALDQQGTAAPVHLLIVPTSEGLAFVSVYGDTATAEAILATVTAT